MSLFINIVSFSFLFDVFDGPRFEDNLVGVYDPSTDTWYDVGTNVVPLHNFPVQDPQIPLHNFPEQPKQVPLYNFAVPGQS